ncbi:ABCB family ABC transporter ATP-binding protein/permease [Metapseudomonas furukawaii]|jgi:ATP-binding cassette subfamily B protein|uniref:Lipid A export ATP-binding/permease protein MsbA n=1 Tax=Metapseudomonas furukawaii TaxID=1149133 RepID=A0AAD1BYJ0_METFU|nr:MULTISPECIES: ABC transporter ATP-binding protein/permease [Pseudomonas]ELS28744.1 Lipid A export ATP-binding/permease protein MsbA [Pseudomonas furukawaii]OWJ94983.1 metal ABC transporter permease [Pseudomonas sp. A46]WAG80695.1 ABC transporter ATP-binding protein/permease [Pseudomonas furukawaii]BAU73520.1 lipid A export ATP-binding/permease protein MsbA [Pseudomonas furukawaii]
MAALDKQTPTPQANAGGTHEGAAPVARKAGSRGDAAVIATLLPYLRPYTGRIALALGLILAAKLANLYVPIALKQIVDQLNVAPSLVVLPAGLLLAYGTARIGVTLFTELRQVVFARVMARASRQITLKVFQHLHGLSLKFHLGRRTGGVARDVERGGSAISDLLDWTLYTIVPTLLEVILVTAVLVWAYDWGFAFITLATLVAYGLWTVAVTEWRTRYYRAAVEADTRANERAVDSLLNYETVKYFNNEAHEAARYDENLRHLENAKVKATKSLALLNLGQTAIVALGVTAMMWRAAAGVVAGELTIGDLVLVNTYLLQLSAPLFMLGMMYREVKQSLTNMERLFGLLDERQDVRDAEGAVPLQATRPRVRFEQVHFGYDPRREILHGVDFEIPPGGTVAVVGHSGSGKSTLARLLYRFYDIDGGHIRIDGHDLRELTQSSLRGAIGIVPQDTVLFNDSIYYNISYGRPDASREEVEAAARAAHIHDFILRLPDGYETQVGERGLKLSGGEKQRVAIARALLKNPAILIFDEATSALDSKSEKAIQTALDRIQEGRTTLVIAHRLSTVMDADQILVLDAGRVIEKGTHRELLEAGGTYAQMWTLQQQEPDVQGSPLPVAPT